MTPLPAFSLSSNDCELLRNWASAYGAAVRQRTVCQETTMAKHGTLPEFVYQRHLIVGEKVSLNFELYEDEHMHDDIDPKEHAIDENNSESSEEGQDQFDESSDEDFDITADGPDDSTLQGQQGQHDELGTSTNCLFGARSRYGRAVRFNNRLLFQRTKIRYVL